MKLTDYVVQYIEAKGIDSVFGYIGGSIADLVDSLAQSNRVRFIQSYNEQASAFCANSYAQITGKTGVAVSSSGPGAINMINGIANAYFDSIPCVFITGNVHSLSKNKTKQIRQNAFQETDIVSMVQDITKYAVYLENACDIRHELEKAFFIANNGRKGPVLIDIPYDIQRQDIDITKIRQFQPPATLVSQNKTAQFLQLLKKAKRPVILAGGGCLEAKQELKTFLAFNQIPLVVSMRGLDLAAHETENYIGLVGSYGNRAANWAVKYADLLLVLGSRLDERQMGYKKEEFAPHATIIQVDIDAAELGRKADCELVINNYVKDFLQEALAYKRVAAPVKWLGVLRDLSKKYISFDDSKHCMSNFIHFLSEAAAPDAIITTDVGQNQIVASQVFKVRENQRFLSSCGLACMGYALPAAIGCYYAGGKRQIISINGDGGLQMNIQELETVRRENLPIKIVVLHNNCLGLIRKLQEKMFHKRYFASSDGFSCPDLQKIAAAYNLAYASIKDTADYAQAAALLKNQKSCLIDVRLPLSTSAIPEPDSCISAQYPPIEDSEMLKIEKLIKEVSS